MADNPDSHICQDGLLFLQTGQRAEETIPQQSEGAITPEPGVYGRYGD